MARTETAGDVDAGRRPGPTRPTIGVLYRLTPWWAKVLVIFVMSRVVTTLLLLVFAALQPANPWTAAHPDYFSFAGIWDGNWFHIVGTSGYPSTVPTDAQGHITENAWAFLPAYPTIVTALSVIAGLSFNTAGVIVSMLFAAGAALMFYRVLVPQPSSSTALFSVALFCFAPLSPILQVVYAESMQVFFLLVALYFLQRRRYWAMLPFIAIASFTRPTGLAFALALALHVIYRWVVRRTQPFPPREAVSAILAGLITAVLGYAWPAIAGLVTGIPDAYMATELSWRSPYVGFGPLVPFMSWVEGASWWGDWIGLGVSPTVAVIAVVVAVVAFGALLFTKPVRRLGVDLRLWTASWVIYLLAVFFPQSSVFRLLIPAFPLLGALAQPRSAAYRIGIILTFIIGQFLWIYFAFWFNGYDWTPP